MEAVIAIYAFPLIALVSRIWKEEVTGILIAVLWRAEPWYPAHLVLLISYFLNSPSSLVATDGFLQQL